MNPSLPPWFAPPAPVIVREVQSADIDALVEARRSFVGGSDVAAILGVSPHNTAYGVWLQKKGIRPQSTKAKEHNTPSRWGLVLEEPIALEYGEMHGLTVGKWPGLALEEHPRLVANPDFWTAEESAILEIKRRSEFVRSKFGRVGTDQIPDDILTQAAWYLAISGAPECRVPVLFGTMETFLVKYDRALCQQILERVIAWVARHLDGEEPVKPSEADGRAAYDNARRLFPRASKAKTLRPLGDDRKLLLDFREAAKAARTANQREEFVQAQIAELMKDAYAVETHDEKGALLRATLGEQRGRTKVDWNALLLDVRNRLQLVTSLSAPDVGMDAVARAGLAHEALGWLDEALVKYTTKSEETTRVFRPNGPLTGKEE